MKKFLSLMLAAIISLSTFATTAYATETGTCNITFDVTDETGGYPGSVIMVELVSDSLGTAMGYTLYAANSWNADTDPVFTLTAGTYTVAITGLETGYKVVNSADYSEDLGFTAAGDMTLSWSIITENTEYVETTDTTEEEETTTVATVTVSANDEEAAEVWDAFITAVSYIADDPAWESFLNYYNKYENCALNYIKYFGGTEEDWAAIDPFDQFLIYETYIRFALRLDSGMYSTYFDSQYEFESTVIKTLLNRMDVVDESEDVQAAYTILADWQYEQIVNNHAVYNFFEVATEEAIVEQEVEEVAEPEEVVEEEITEEIPEEDTEEEEAMAGMWETVLSIIKSHFVEVGIGVGGLAVLGVVFIIRRRNSYNDYDDDDEEL